MLFLLAGWSRGEESLVARPELRTLNDLKGKRIALEPKTSAHSFLLITLDLAGLEYGEVTVVPARSSSDAAESFIAGKADAAMIWTDDKTRCLRAVSGAHVLESTKDASFLIAESLVVSSDVLKRREADITHLAKGWLRANAAINADQGSRRPSRHHELAAPQRFAHVRFRGGAVGAGEAGQRGRSRGRRRPRRRPRRRRGSRPLASSLTDRRAEPLRPAGLARHRGASELLRRSATSRAHPGGQ